MQQNRNKQANRQKSWLNLRSKKEGKKEWSMKGSNAELKVQIRKSETIFSWFLN